jgi:S-adenosylmethionine synthetase
MDNGYLFTSESVAIGHPDKVADQISDAILDALLVQDPDSRVACECLITDRLLVIAGEVATRAAVDYAAVARHTLKKIGYGAPESGFDLSQAEILTRIHEQSPDISRGVMGKTLGAGDQGMMFGYAVNETPHLMPLSQELANRLTLGLSQLKQNTPWLRPDGKSQVTIAYDSQGKPLKADTILLSSQHDPHLSHDEVKERLTPFIQSTIGEEWLTPQTRLLINPTGRFVTGGPAADTGLTGRKLIVDTYGGRAHHGGGAFSGKDGTKVDRSGAYTARYIAKHIVAAGITPECEVMLAYAIGLADPIALKINTFGHYKKERALEKLILSRFPVTPEAMIETFGLKRPIFEPTAFGGHFGREGFPWEALDRLSVF